MNKIVKKCVSGLLILTMIAMSLVCYDAKVYAAEEGASPTDAIADEECKIEKQFQNYSVSLKVVDQWENGRNIEIEVTNLGDESILNWCFKYDVNGVITSIWNAQVVDSLDSM